MAAELPECPELNQLMEKWGISGDDENEFAELPSQMLLELGMSNFGIVDEQLRSGSINEQVASNISEVELILRNYKTTHATKRYPPKYNLLLETIYYAARCLKDINRWHITKMPGYYTGLNSTDHVLHKFSILTEEAIVDVKGEIQQLLIFLYDRLETQGFKRYRGDCWKEIRTDEGHFTHAWENIYTISEFMNRNINRSENFEVWKLKNANGGVERAVQEKLKSEFDSQFPDIEVNRHVFSFSNGVLHVRWQPTEDEFPRVKFFPYASSEFMNRDIVAAKYFKTPLTDWEQSDWNNIPTPTLDRILKDQFADPEMKKWMFIFLGRMLYNLNDIDSWQVLPYIKGIAATGKSTILTHVVRKFYNPGDYATMSNNIEQKFGLANLADKFLFIAPEVKQDFGLCQAEFQSLISGEDMSIARKGISALNIRWLTPGIMAGNSIPAWEDNAGSMKRRIVFFHFGQQITKKDSQLDKKLEPEIPNIILKSAMAYLEVAKENVGADIWSILPTAFIDERDEALESINSLEAFIKSENVLVGDDLYYEWSSAKELIRSYCITNNYPRPHICKSYYEAIFNEHNIVIYKSKGKEPMPKCIPEHLRNSGKDFVVGFSYKSEISRNDDFY